MAKRTHPLMHIVAAAIACLALVSSGFAQKLEKGQVEGTGQVGIVTGIGTRASLAASAGTALTDRVFAFGEFGWIPLGGSSSVSSTTPGNSFGFETSGRLLTFMGGAHYQFDETHSLVPYAG